MNFLNALEERVKMYQKSTGKTRQQIAAELGITRQSFHSKMCGNTEFSLTEAASLADILGCTVDDLRVYPEQNDTQAVR